MAVAELESSRPHARASFETLRDEFGPMLAEEITGPLQVAVLTVAVYAPSPSGAIILHVNTGSGDLPSQRGETWNDTEAINRHREMTPSERVALAIEASRAALLFAEGRHIAPDDPVRA